MNSCWLENEKLTNEDLKNRLKNACIDIALDIGKTQRTFSYLGEKSKLESMRTFIELVNSADNVGCESFIGYFFEDYSEIVCLEEKIALINYKILLGCSLRRAGLLG